MARKVLIPEWYLYFQTSYRIIQNEIKCTTEVSQCINHIHIYTYTHIYMYIYVCICCLHIKKPLSYQWDIEVRRTQYMVHRIGDNFS